MGELATLDRDRTPPPLATIAPSRTARTGAATDPAGMATRTAEASPLAIAATLAAQSRRAPKTRQDYQAIYDRFLGWLEAHLGRAPQLEDLTEVALLAWRNHRETSGGRAGTGLAPSSLRTELAALRVLARRAGRPDLAFGLELPRHSPAPPESLSDAEYDLLVRVPDQRSTIGRRDAAILQVLGDAGLRSAELRTLYGADLVRARRDSPRRSLRVARGKGGRGRTIRLTKAADELLDRWLAVHPLRQAERGAGRTRQDGFWLPDELPLFCTLGRGHGDDAGRPMSADALEKARRPPRPQGPHPRPSAPPARAASLLPHPAGQPRRADPQDRLPRRPCRHPRHPAVPGRRRPGDRRGDRSGRRLHRGARPRAAHGQRRGEGVVALQGRGGPDGSTVAAAASTR